MGGNVKRISVYFCLRGKGCEARSSQAATRLQAVSWFESLLLVWRLHSRTIRLVARFLFAGGKGNRVLFRARPQLQGFRSFSPECSPLPWHFKEESGYELLKLTRLSLAQGSGAARHISA